MLVMTYNNIRNKFVVALCACFCKVMASDSCHCHTFVFVVNLPKKSTQKSKALDKLDR